MKIWIVLYEHRHGVDAWPEITKPTIKQVEEELRADGSWDEDDETGRSHIEIRGPWEVRPNGNLQRPRSCWPTEES